MDSDKYDSCNLQLQPAPKIWWTRREVAERFGLASQTLAGWAVAGTGPKPAKIGGRVRYHIADIESFEQQIRASEAPDGNQVA